MWFDLWPEETYPLPCRSNKALLTKLSRRSEITLQMEHFIKIQYINYTTHKEYHAYTTME